MKGYIYLCEEDYIVLLIPDLELICDEYGFEPLSIKDHENLGKDIEDTAVYIGEL